MKCIKIIDALNDLYVSQIRSLEFTITEKLCMRAYFLRTLFNNNKKSFLNMRLNFYD